MCSYLNFYNLHHNKSKEKTFNWIRLHSTEISFMLLNLFLTWTNLCTLTSQKIHTFRIFFTCAGVIFICWKKYKYALTRIWVRDRSVRWKCSVCRIMPNRFMSDNNNRSLQFFFFSGRQFDHDRLEREEHFWILMFIQTNSIFLFLSFYKKWNFNFRVMMILFVSNQISYFLMLWDVLV